MVPRALDDALPRMDVCGFVGFAARGPIDVPVLVEDPVAFRDVFGDDPVLARTDDGSDVRAHLGLAVEAFFANGGRRAWVVRVARTGPGGAITNRFGVPGLVLPGPPGGGVSGWRLAALAARSPGAWSDGLTVGATLVVESLVGTVLDDEHLLVDHGANVVPGDLVRVTLADGEHLLAPAAEVRRHGDGRLVVVDPDGGWLVADRPTEIARGDAHLLRVDGPVTLPTFEITSLVSEDGIEVGGSAPLRPGDVVAIEPLPPDEAITLVTVGDELFDGAAPGSGASRSRSSPPSFRDPPAGPLGCLRPPIRWSSIPYSYRLTVRRDTAVEAELDGLGLSVRHPRAVAALPADDQLYPLLAGLPRTSADRPTTVEDLVTRELTALERAAAAPRFPLAALGSAPLLVLPVAVTTDPAATRFGAPAAEVDLAPAPVRNGLAEFGADLFVDPALAGLGIDTVMPAAWDLAYVKHPPRRLRGIHALAMSDDITLVCVPDAVHHGWQRIPIPAPVPLRPPRCSPRRSSMTRVPTSAGAPSPRRPATSSNTGLRTRRHRTGSTSTAPGRRSTPGRAARTSSTCACGPPAGASSGRGRTSSAWSCRARCSRRARRSSSPMPGPGSPGEQLPDEVVWRQRPAAEAEPWTELRAIQVGDPALVRRSGRCARGARAAAHVHRGSE